MDAVRKKWAEQTTTPPAPAVKAAEETTKLLDARKKIIHIVNWELNDDKHRKLEQIKDTVNYLVKILGNVKEHPTEEKYRKIRISNATFGRHVRDASGGEAFMIAAGWHATVVDHERYFVFEEQPGTLQWQIFEEASKELGKLDTLLEAKIARNFEDKKAEIEARREAARAAIAEDKELRHSKFTYSQDS